MNYCIYQIYYSKETKANNDQGFLQLDNLANNRPDWREYWPIRNFLLNTVLEEDNYYGFFSPKFKLKTNLDSSDVFSFVNDSDGTTDAFLFSPFFDQSAFPLNIFIQMETQELGFTKKLEEFFLELNNQINITDLVMSSKNIVFCNYFVANKKFWLQWLAMCERIFHIAENSKSKFSDFLNSEIEHDGGFAPVKVFVIERIAAYILSTQKSWSTKPFNPMKLPYTDSFVSNFKSELCILDSLKIAYAENQYDNYINEFIKIRNNIIN